MSQPKTVDRGVVLLKFVLDLLKAHSEGMRPRDIYREIEAKVPLDAFDQEIMGGSGLPRWRVTLHFRSVAATKAGYLTKLDGRWLVTDGGLKAAMKPLEELKKELGTEYRKWRSTNRTAELDAALPDDSGQSGASVLFEDAKEKARNEIDEYLDTVTAYEFQDLVAALLEGMGYTPRIISPPGPDGGTDVLAYIDPLGARTPHIRVQVKHKDQSASREEVAALRGIIRSDREIGLFVYSGGFSRDARREASSGAVHIELVDLDRFLELWIQHYEKIPDSKKSKLRLFPIYFLAPEIGE